MNLHMHPPAGLRPGSRRCPYSILVYIRGGGKKRKPVSFRPHREADLLDCDYIRKKYIMQACPAKMKIRDAAKKRNLQFFRYVSGKSSSRI